MSNLDPLSALAEKYGTDKGPLFHNYTRFYDFLLGARRNSTENVLEIGIDGGASLRMWRDYFPNAQITGVDSNRGCLFQEERILTILGNQDSEFLPPDLPPQDLIVDDGSHFTKHQISSFKVLWDKVRVGGTYIIEDIDTSFRPEYVTSDSTAFEFWAAQVHPRSLRGHLFTGQKGGMAACLEKIA